MASNDNDSDAEYALSRLLQMGTVAEYQKEFEILVEETEARFEVIAEKEQNIKEKVDTTLSLPSEEASPVVIGPLDASKDTLLFLRSEDPNFKIQETGVKYVRALNVNLKKTLILRDCAEALYENFLDYFRYCVSEPVVNDSNVECEPKVWSNAPIIEEYESDSEDKYVSILTKEHETPSFANKQVKTPRANVKNPSTHSQKPKVDKKELGYGFTVRARFVCGSLNHLIRDCDFHEKRMARKAELNNGLRTMIIPHRAFKGLKELLIVDVPGT
ncbi:hypothetical protein Tco_0804208 [Tanacetum coccineum]|uniref:Uncharacterized protein n=1 Tax=Tanacetum coccineum TaxID=301880 RepID=A0ABQ5A7Y6_9ASTR